MSQFVAKSLRHRAKARLNGFSLVELIVVMAVIAVLASLLLPAMATARHQAQSVQCVSNLHQLGVALNVYTEDFTCFPLATEDGITGAWQHRLTVPEPILYCPVESLPSTNFVQIFNWTQGEVSPHYGYNVLGAAREGSPPYNPGLGGDVNAENDSRIATKLNRVINPAQMITIADSATFLDVIFGTQPQASIPNQIYLAFPYNVPPINTAGVGNWHDNGANLLFGDCHVQFGPQSYWIAATDQSRRLWNSDNQPHEEWW